MSALGTRLLRGLAAALLAHAAWLVLLIPLWEPVPVSFQLANLSVLVTVHLVAALALGWIREERAWAAAVFLAPVALALLRPAYDVGGASVAVALAIATASLFLAWTRWGPAASPVASAVLGTVVAGALLWIGGLALPTAFYWISGFAVLAAGGFLACVPARLPGTLPAPLLCTLAGAFAVLLAIAGALRPSDSPFRWDDSRPSHRGDGKPPVVLIVLDTTRVDHLAMGDYTRDTMPRLESFARREAVRFRRAVSSGSWTLPSHASMFTGLHPPDHGAHFPNLGHDDPPVYYPLREDVPTLAELLGDAGYWTVGIAANYAVLRAKSSLARGFDQYTSDRSLREEIRALTPWSVPGLHALPIAAPLAALQGHWPFSEAEYFIGVNYVRATGITDLALEAVRAAGNHTFFIFLNYMDAHEPTIPPHQCMDRFPGRRAWLGMVGVSNPREHRVRLGQPLSSAEREHAAALYDSELACLDQALGRLFDGLREHPRWSEMMVIVTSDHGEALGEHGDYGHGTNLYNEQISVPFIVKPGTGAGQGRLPASGSVLDGPVESVDVFATVLEHAGVQAPRNVDGRPWGRGRTHARSWLYRPDLPRSLLSMDRYERELRSVLRGDLKLVRSTTGAVELYDLAVDSGEDRDLSANRPVQRKQLMALLGADTHESPGVVLGPPPDIDPDLGQRLRELGYLSD